MRMLPLTAALILVVDFKPSEDRIGILRGAGLEDVVYNPLLDVTIY